MRVLRAAALRRKGINLFTLFAKIVFSAPGAAALSVATSIINSDKHGSPRPLSFFNRLACKAE
jgi:hypothetical protein